MYNWTLFLFTHTIFCVQGLLNILPFNIMADLIVLWGPQFSFATVLFKYKIFICTVRTSVMYKMCFNHFCLWLLPLIIHIFSNFKFLFYFLYPFLLFPLETEFLFVALAIWNSVCRQGWNWPQREVFLTFLLSVLDQWHELPLPG